MIGKGSILGLRNMRNSVNNSVSSRVGVLACIIELDDPNHGLPRATDTARAT